MRQGVAGFLLLAAAATPLGAQLTIRITSVPANTPPGARIHVAGSFNRWNPGDPGYVLAAQPGGGYSLTLPDTTRGAIEFKFTLGSWETVETTAAGADVANREYTIPAQGRATLTATVAAWRTGPKPPPRHTASRSVSILSDSFPMPQLGRSRRVWLYLPPGYASSDKRYPVLYMHDGQNVFDEATGFAGEWGVDETLDSLAARGDPGAIVVAVDNGGTHRMDEYDPWVNAKKELGGGEGDAYVEFLVRTLKPYVDRHYRTRPEAASTGIMGSSMGGLISLYAALKYPDVFGRAGVFSCACWVAGAPLYRYAGSSTGTPVSPRIYFVSGAFETKDGQPAGDQRIMVDSLVKAGYPAGRSLRAITPADGKHAEWFWRREFPAAYRWLFGERSSPVEQ